MLLKNKAMVSMAALTLAGGTVMLSMSGANAATIRCGSACQTLASQKFGATNVVSVGSSSTGELAPFYYDESEDFYPQLEGNVSELAKAGAIAHSVAKTYGSDQVYQYVYSPAGNATDKCLGATEGSSAVTLVPCGATANSLWVTLGGWKSGNFEPLLSAALSVNSAMLLTASTASGALAVTQMNLGTTVSNGVSTTSPSSVQMWETVNGAYGSSTTGGQQG